MRGIRFGSDLTRPIQDLWTKGDRYGYEFSADMELWPNLFPTFETGYDVMKIQTPNVDYAGQGPYSRIGIDYNFLEAQSHKDKDILFIGFRYGFTAANQQVNQYLIDYYWGQTIGSYPTQSYFGHWGEIVLGLKGEIFRNFYLGWSVRGKIKFNHADLGMPPVYFIPGFGKADKGFRLDFTYSVFYNIQWEFRKKKDTKATEAAAEKAKTPEVK